MTIDERVRSGITAVGEGRHADAVAHFESALELAPDRPDLHNALGMAWLHLSDVERALPPLRRAVEIVRVTAHVEGADPSEVAEQLADMHLHFADALASALEAVDRVREAAAVLRDVVAAVPDATAPRLRLGRMLLGMGELDEALPHLDAVAEDDGNGEDVREGAADLASAVRQFRDQEVSPLVFLEAHAAEYKAWFDQVVSEVGPAWYAEAARMSRGPDGQPKPLVDPAARPYAFQRVDLVNPADGSVSDVYSAEEPMIVAVDGFDLLAATPVVFEAERVPYRLFVSSQCPWHWLQIVVRAHGHNEGPRALEQIDAAIGHWYQAGYHGEFGTRESGRFHYVSDPAPLGSHTVAYHVDLGRAGLSAFEGLRRVFAVLHDRVPLDRVLIGSGRMPE